MACASPAYFLLNSATVSIECSLRAQARRTISAREATGLRRQAADIQRQYATFSRGGLDRNEVRTLQDRVNDVRVHLRMERRDWDGRRG